MAAKRPIIERSERGVWTRVEFDSLSDDVQMDIECEAIGLDMSDGCQLQEGFLASDGHYYRWL